MKPRQVRDDWFFEIDKTAFDLLQNEGRGQGLCDGSEKKSGVVEHRRAGDDVRHAMSHDDLAAVVIDAGKITWHIVRVAIGGGLPAKVSRNSLECATSRSLTGATQPHQLVI